MNHIMLKYVNSTENFMVLRNDFLKNKESIYNKFLIIKEKKIKIMNSTKQSIFSKQKTSQITQMIDIYQEREEDIKIDHNNIQSQNINQILDYQNDDFKSKSHKLNQLQQRQSISSECSQNSQYWEKKERSQNMTTKQSQKIMDKTKIKQKTKIRRLSNFVTSNTIRTLMKNIKDMLYGTNKPVYELIKNFQKDHSIQGQIWGYDILLTYLLYLKDIQNLILPQQFSGIITLTKSKLTNQRKHLQISKKLKDQFNHETYRNTYEIYINHLEFYKDKKFSYFQTDQCVRYKQQEFLEKIIVKRRVIVNDYIRNIMRIQGQFKMNTKSKQQFQS